MLKLQFIDRRQPALWLVDERLTIGRDRSNRLVIDDEGISVFHAEIRNEGGKLFLSDAGSVNGTYLNGHRIVQREEIHSGDVIRLHMIDLEVVDPATAVKTINTQAINREPPKPAPLPWQLKALTGPTSGKMIPVTSTTVVGRDPSSDLPVNGAHVSRRHAELSIHGGHLHLKDLNSSNGTFLNGKRVDGDVDIALKNGDEVRFDAMIFKVVAPANLSVEEDEVEKTMFRAAVVVPATGSVNPVGKPEVTKTTVPPKATSPAAAPMTKPTAQAVPPVKPEPRAPVHDTAGNGLLVLAVMLALIAMAVLAWVFLGTTVTEY